jgi:hypothetical protein
MLAQKGKSKMSGKVPASPPLAGQLPQQDQLIMKWKIPEP